MTVTARRIYYSLAIVIFLILAPIILSIANGYQWAGWRHGFVPTGVLVISASPKATVSINGQAVESTTKLTERLRPGQYEISLSRTGYTPWKTLISIQANTANVIGPALLFPTTLPPTNHGDSWPITLIDPVNQNIVGAGPSTVGWEVQQLWPSGSRLSMTIPNEPRNIWFSPKQRVIVLNTATAAFVTSPGSSEVPWMIDRVDRAVWGNQGDAVFYVMRGQQLFRIDSLAKTESFVAARTSVGWFDGQLWSTEAHASGLTLLYRQAADAVDPILVRNFVGQWLIEAGPDGTLLVRNQSDHQTVAYLVSNSAEALPLGVVDQWWWSNRTIPPLWQSGTQLYTLNDEAEPLLLERGPENYQAVYWIVPRHILVSLEEQTLTIRSVSARQGRGTIMQQKLTAPAELIGVDRGRKVLILRTTDAPSFVFTLSWQ